MKKILFLIPLLGICSMLLAQAPQVTNVQAEQVQGTKDVQVSFELTGKPGASLCFIEVWFKTDSAQTQWQQVKSIPYDAGNPNGLQETLFDLWDEFGNPIGQDKAFTAGATESLQYKMFTWNAGNDVPDVNTQDARIRIIAFYPKMEEWGDEKPLDQQKSGWNGEGDFGASGSNPDSNGTAGTDTNGTNEGPDVYFLNPTQVGDATSYSTEAAGYYAFEAFYDEPAEHNGYVGTEVKQLIAVWDDAGIWRHDQGIGPWQLSSALFPTLDSVGVWISNNQLTSQGKVTYNDPNPGDGI